MHHLRLLEKRAWKRTMPVVSLDLCLPAKETSQFDAAFGDRHWWRESWLLSEWSPRAVAERRWRPNQYTQAVQRRDSSGSGEPLSQYVTGEVPDVCKDETQSWRLHVRNHELQPDYNGHEADGKRPSESVARIESPAVVSDARMSQPFPRTLTTSPVTPPHHSA